MKTCQILFVFAAILHIPITMFPGREQIYIYYNLKRTNKTHFIMTAIITLITVIVPCVYPDIIGLLGLLGGITVGNTGYTIPYMLKLRSLSKVKWYTPRKLKYYVILFIVTFLSVGSIYVSLTMGGGGH